MTNRIALAMLFIAQCTPIALHAYDVLLEGKAAAFVSTDCIFKDIYGRAGGLYGFEITAGEYRNIYGFASVDVFHKSGSSIGFCNSTKVTFVELGLGLKYFVPFRFGDFYLGLGALPTHLKTKDCSPAVIQSRSTWGCGGIAKIGAYFDLPRSFFIDLFFDYAFIKIPFDCCFNGCTQDQTANLNGCVLGGGIGYRFN